VSIRGRIVLTVTLQKVDYAPNSKPRTEGDDERLQYVNRAVEKFHIILHKVLFWLLKRLYSRKKAALINKAAVIE
jgi:hypothetical protein